MPTNKSSLWSKYFILALLAALFTNMCMAMLDSTLSLFADDMWNSKTLGGYLTSFFNAGSILMAFFSGRLVDKRGRRRCFVVGTVLFAIPTLAMAIWPSPIVALSARFVQGVAKGVVTVAAVSMVSDIIPRERLGEGMGLYGLGQTVPRAIGPMAGLMLTENGSYMSMFVVCTVMYLLAGVATMGIDYEKHQSYSEHAEVESSGNENYKGVWKLIEKKALPAAVNYTIYFFSTSIILVFLAVFSREILMFGTSQISLFYIVSAVAILLIRLFCGKLSDRYGALCVLIPGHIANILALLILIFWSKNNLLMYLVAATLYGVGSAAIMPTLNAVAVVDSPKGRNGAANASFYFLMDVGMLIGSAMIGAIVDNASSPTDGYTTSFLICIMVCVLSLVMSCLLFNKKARERRTLTYRIHK